MTRNIDFPRVLEVSKEDGSLKLTLEITADLNVFEGHFDNAPIVPGIVQIAWALGFSNEYLALVSAADISGLESVKFQNVVIPEQVLCLEMHMQQQKLCFSYSSEKGKHSSGKIATK